jgi:DNA repair photolyase
MQACPVSCRYCMAAKIDARSRFWNGSYRIGANKTCTFVNRFPGDPPLSRMDIPWNLMRGELLGFEGASDCFWDVYDADLRWLLDRLDDFGIQRLVLTTKIPVTERQAAMLCGKRVCVIYSVTGLDALERTTTDSRIEAMSRLRELGIETHPLIHPYIYGYSDLSFLPKLARAGFHEAAVKGFRYNSRAMNLSGIIPDEILSRYKGDESEESIGLDHAKEAMKESGIMPVPLRSFLRPEKEYAVPEAEAKRDSEALIKRCVISSSANVKAVVDAMIARRTGNIIL